MNGASLLSRLLPSLSFQAEVGGIQTSTDEKSICLQRLGCLYANVDQDFNPDLQCLRRQRECLIPSEPNTWRNYQNYLYEGVISDKGLVLFLSESLCYLGLFYLNFLELPNFFLYTRKPKKSKVLHIKEKV